MTGTARFVCTDPDAGDFEFADVESVLDALEAGLVAAATPLFDAARQSRQPVGMHPEIRAAWEARLRFRPPGAPGPGLPALPSLTELARSLPSEDDEGEERREAFARMKQGVPVEVRTRGAPAEQGPRFAAMGVVWVVLLLALVGWAIVIFAARLSDVAARAAGVGSSP